ncbi:DNA topology modulation protein FlaR [Clostridium gasigenes]|uniref:DNA topology modulation protein FlaR n=1 Tax=Clostridium gasigenes TaxID=94869 RepID=UPI001C0BCCB1|nr:DNA topology modulation protein FlaR [Clostridium gasigenes]MBU3107572.1 DNA topology modulation protein FlaR [Clostridium gasigenes]
MKIHIIGGSDMGKSYVSGKISGEFNIPHYDLDNIFWDSEAGHYGVKMPTEKRTDKLNSILKNSNWVIEGVYYSWLNDSFSTADYIFILNSPVTVYRYRIIKRFLKRKIGFEKGKKETLKSLIDLLTWTDDYQKNKIPVILEFLEPYKEKIILLEKANDIFNYIK